MDVFAVAHQGIQYKLAEHLRSPIPLLQKLIDYAFEKPGKNIRSRLMIALCLDHQFDPFDEHFQNIAATMELIHAATLFHDDVIDSSEERRNRATVPMAYSNTCSILLGDYCFSKSYMLIKNLPNQAIFCEKISQTAQDLIAGEVWQYEKRGQTVSLSQYFKIIELKTARLFELATRSLFLIDSETFSEDIALIGRDFGMLFQLLDDYFDYFRVPGALHSKPAGKDFEERKMTLPVILALEHNIISSAEIFWSQETTFDEFLDIISCIEPYCKELITERYNQLSNDMLNFPLAQSVLEQAKGAFMPPAHKAIDCA